MKNWRNIFSWFKALRMSLFLLFSFALFGERSRESRLISLREDLKAIQSGLDRVLKTHLKNSEKITLRVTKRSVPSGGDLLKIKQNLEEVKIGLEEVSEKREEKNLPQKQTVIIDRKPNNEAFLRVRKDLEEVRIGLEQVTQERVKSFPKDHILPVNREDSLKDEFPVLNGDTPLRKGLYLLPFLGLYHSQNLEWKSKAGEFEISQKTGFSSGFRFGYGWKLVFADFQLSYFHNDLGDLDAGLPSMSFSGETKGMGAHFSVGTKVPLSESFDLKLALGIGGISQDLSFHLMDMVVEEEKFLLSGQLLGSIEYYPNQNLSFSLGYRWMNLSEMELFSSRDLHLAELSLGYRF